MGRGKGSETRDEPTSGTGDLRAVALCAGAELPHVLYFDDLAQVLNCTPAALRKRISREDVPRPIKLGGRLAWSRAIVLDFLAEIHGAQKRLAVKINARPYTYDTSRMLVTFTLQIKGQPRQRVRKVAPAGLDHAGSLAWARRIEGEVLRELMGEKKEVRNEEPPRRVTPQTHVRQPAATKAPTLAQFWDRFWVDYVAKKKPGTRRTYVSFWTNYLRPTLGHVPIDMIDKSAIALLRESLTRLEEVSSRNQVLYKLKTILEMAVEWDLIDDIPKIKAYKEPKKPEPVVYTEHEADRLILAAHDQGRETAAIVLLLLHGGLRVSEVRALRWRDIDFGRGLMMISHNYSAGEESTPKGVVSAPVGLSPALATALRALPRHHDHVLVRDYQGEVTHHSIQSIRSRLNAAQQAAGLPKTGPHFLRHTGITILASRGLDVWKLQAHARHARIATTQRYVHIAKEAAVLDAAAVWAPPGPPAKTRPKRPKGTGNGATSSN